jgi:repressor LexA
MQEKLLNLSKVKNLSKLSYREIGRQLNDSDDPKNNVHPSSVKYHLEQLIKDGLIDVSQKRVSRLHNIRNNAGTTLLGLIKIPIVGSANCGPATIFAEDRIEGYLEVSPQLLKSRNYNDLYVLKADGNSMNKTDINGKTINDGDYVVVDRSKITPKSGERVVVVRDDMANIKQIYFDYEHKTVVLRSESTETFNPIYFSPNDEWDGLIGGTVVDVMKNSKPSFA